MGSFTQRASEGVLPTTLTCCGMKVSLQYELGKEFEKCPGRPWEFLQLSKLSRLSDAIWDTGINMTHHKGTSICDALAGEWLYCQDDSGSLADEGVRFSVVQWKSDILIGSLGLFQEWPQPGPNAVPGFSELSFSSTFWQFLL